MECRNCGTKMVIPNISLKSDDDRMHGDYCSRNCVDTRRQSIPPFHDLSYLKRNKTSEPVVETKKVVVPEVKSRELDLQGLDLLFNPPE